MIWGKPITAGLPALAGAVLLTVLSAGPVAADDTLFVRSADIDVGKMQVTLPLREGRMTDGEGVWYVLLDASDRDTADRLGINFSAKLANAGAYGAVREARLAPDGSLQFESGAVDFAPERMVTPGPARAPFPPRAAQPGSVGDADYSPLVRIAGGAGTVFNAPVLAYGVDAGTLNRFCDGDTDHALTHDKVVRICPRDGTVTLSLTDGFAGGKRLTYISTESDVALVAALEGATYAPRLDPVAANQGRCPVQRRRADLCGCEWRDRGRKRHASGPGKRIGRWPVAAQHYRRCARAGAGLQPALGLAPGGLVAGGHVFARFAVEREAGAFRRSDRAASRSRWQGCAGGRHCRELSCDFHRELADTDDGLDPTDADDVGPIPVRPRGDVRAGQRGFAA